jgi:glycosyltransferase involved in cell wall biosynthesis
MRVSLIAPPFIPVPPVRYGGTELFISQLAEGLKELGIDVVVYANGESTVNVEVRSLYEQAQWPIEGEVYANLKDLNHTSWAIRDAWHESDIIHLNNVPGLAFSRFPGPEFVYTIHHVHNEVTSEFYGHLPDVNYVTISKFQQARERMPKLRTIHHGVDMSQYSFEDKKQPYLAFLGRIAPLKGTHLAIEVAKKSGVPLKVAGEIQPCFREYFETQIRPHIDGKFIEYVGEADLREKNELLANATAMLFPIQWDEPFGLVMIESMATGTPVLALPGGAVDEVVLDGVSGYICKDIDEMVRCVDDLGDLRPTDIRNYTEVYFSVPRMVREYVQLYEEILNGRLRHLPAAVELMDEPEEPRAIA